MKVSRLLLGHRTGALMCPLTLDESVKEAFASQLHRVLWYYFTVSRIH